MKKFVLTCTEDAEGMIAMKMTNEGFNGMELIAILDTKKADLIEQVTHPEKFRYEREYKDTDGSTLKKFKEGEETSEENYIGFPEPFKNAETCKHCAFCGRQICKTVNDGDVCPYFVVHEEEK